MHDMTTPPPSTPRIPSTYKGRAGRKWPARNGYSHVGTVEEKNSNRPPSVGLTRNVQRRARPLFRVGPVDVPLVGDAPRDSLHVATRRGLIVGYRAAEEKAQARGTTNVILRSRLRVGMSF